MIMVDIDFVADFVSNRTCSWAITEPLFRAIAARRWAALPSTMTGYPARLASVAILPLYGVLLSRQLSAWGQMMFDLSMSNPAVSTVLIDVDSPGGTIYGVEELSTKIYQARKVRGKSIIASCNSLCAASAYWIASSADEICITPGGELGSIGVFKVHEDISGAMAVAGIKPTIISGGRYKVEGNPYEPLGADAGAAMQARVDDYYSTFVRAVARNRGVKIADVTGGFGEGRVVGATQAVKLGMADRVESFEQTLSRLGAGGGPTGARSMRGDDDMSLDMRARRLRLV